MEKASSNMTPILKILSEGVKFQNNNINPETNTNIA
jgi:hypothetical protein